MFVFVYWHKVYFWPNTTNTSTTLLSIVLFSSTTVCPSERETSWSLLMLVYVWLNSFASEDVTCHRRNGLDCLLSDRWTFLILFPLILSTVFRGLIHYITLRMLVLILHVFCLVFRTLLCLQVSGRFSLTCLLVHLLQSFCDKNSKLIQVCCLQTLHIHTVPSHVPQNSPDEGFCGKSEYYFTLRSGGYLIWLLVKYKNAFLRVSRQSIQIFDFIFLYYLLHMPKKILKWLTAFSWGNIMQSTTLCH